MQREDLIRALADLEIGKSEFAMLLGVTVRAVGMWSSGDREIPGPVAAYLRLLQSLPGALQVREMARLSKGEAIMYDGMYRVEYQGIEGAGTAALIFQNGIVFGHDGGVIYDGDYAPSEPGLMDLHLYLTVPPGVALVQGVAPQHSEYRFEIRARVPARGNAPLKIETPFGIVVCRLSFLRPLPSSLAA